MRPSYKIEGRYVVFEDGTRLPTISGGFGVTFYVIAAVAIAATLAATAVSIYEQQQQASYEASVAKHNEKVQQQNAQMAKDSAGLKATQIRSATERQTAEGVNLMASSGLDTGYGAPLLYELDQAAQTEIAARQAIYAGDVQAQGNVSAAQAYAADAQFTSGAAVGRSLLTGLQGVGGAASTGTSMYLSGSRAAGPTQGTQV